LEAGQRLARLDAARVTCYKVLRLKRSADTTRNGCDGSASLPARFSYFWRFN